MRPSSDIDPAKATVDAKRKRRRKLRNRPDPHPAVKAGEAKALAALERMPINPGVMLEPASDDEDWHYTPLHNDGDLFEKQLAVALGSRSTAVIHTFMSDLRRLCGTAWDADLKRWKADETELNAALGMVADWQPENAAQAALAAQMVAVHWMTMRLSSQALNNGAMVMERDANQAGKLARTYAMLCETMQKLKGNKRTAKQSFSIKRESHHHQHIHVHREGGGEENVGQPQEARAATIEGRASLQGPLQGNGAVVPFPSGEGQDCLPQARRRKSGGT